MKTELRMQSTTFDSRIDGWPVHVRTWSPAGPARAVVVIAHGMAEHGMRYQRFAAALNAAGLVAVVPDHRAHGLTSGPGGLGDFGAGGFDALVDDLGQCIELATAAFPGLPVVLLGHSMGAGAAQQFVQTGSHAIAALVLSGTTLRRPDEPPPDFNARFEPARTAYDWLSRDPLEVDRYIDDPLCGFETQTLVNGPDRNDPRRIDPQRLAAIRGDLPVLIAVGDADPVHRALAGVDLLESSWRSAGVEHIDRLVYPGARHELLNETNREQVTRDILAWIDDRLATG